MSASAVALSVALAVSALALQGCGGDTTPSTTPGPTPSTTSYDGEPPFMLEDVGMKAFSYNPLYLADPSCREKPGTKSCQDIYNDDVSAEWAENMWSPNGRGDIKTMATFGANAVRLYGNDPRFSKRRFFDELLRNNMKAVTGMSDYPFTNNPTGCIYTFGYDCFQNATEGYYQLLTTGEFARNGYYHNAIEIISIMNEPDIHLWVPGAWTSKDNYIKALVSAFDGILSAEKKAGVKPWKKNGKLPKISVSWSYATLNSAVPCNDKGYIKDPRECGPSIGFMAQLFHAIQDPTLTGYTPKNDLKSAYQERFIHALQPFQSTTQVYTQAIEVMQTLPSLKGHKIYLGEFDPAVNACGDRPNCTNYGKKQLEADLKTILTDKKWTSSVIGVSFFQFQEAYNKDGQHELAYGLFKMTEQAPWRTGYIKGDTAKDHPINCLDWKTKDLGEAVAAAYSGSVPTLRCSAAGGVSTEILL